MLKYIVVVTDWNGAETLYNNSENILTDITDITNHTIFDTEQEALKYIDDARKLGLTASKSKKVKAEVRPVEIKESMAVSE